MKVIADNFLTISEAPSSFLSALKEHLTIPNPAYFKMLKMGNARAAYGLQSDFKYYEVSKDGSKMRVGRGMEEWIRQNAPQPFEWYDETVVPFAEIAPNKVIPLRDYQQGVVEQILARRNGITRLGTGFGKTCLMLAVAQKLQTKTLIIVPRTTLADQTCQESERFLDIIPDRLDRNWTSRSSSIHVVTIQTLQHKSKEELYAISKDYGLVCVDESHSSVPKKTRDCIQTFRARHLYGFTGTARRTDGQGAAIGFIFGETLIDRDLPSTPPMVEIIKTGANYFVFEYHELAEELGKDRRRNELIAGIVKREIENGRRILVFTKRCEHRDSLYETILQTIPAASHGIHVIKASGNAKEKLETKELLEKLRSGDSDFNVLVSTLSLAATGLDIPKVDTILFSCDLRSDILVEQGGGRCRRLLEGKKDPKIIDLWDSHQILHAQGRARLAWYASVGWKVEIV